MTFGEVFEGTHTRFLPHCFASEAKQTLPKCGNRCVTCMGRVIRLDKTGGRLIGALDTRVSNTCGQLGKGGSFFLRNL